MPRLNASMLLIALLCAALPAKSASADRASGGPYQFDDVIYTLPAPWEKGRTDDEFVVCTTDSDVEGEEFAYLRIYRSKPLPRDVKSFVRQFAREDLDDKEKFVRMLPQTETVRIGSTDVLLVSSLVKRNGQRVRIYVAAPVGDRLQLLRFEGEADDEEELRGAMGLFGRTSEPLLRSLRFVSKGVDPLLGEPKPGPLDGIFYKSQSMLSVGGGMDVYHYFYVFDENGRFTDELPDGMNAWDLDWDQLIKNSPADAGNYEVVGNVIRLMYADGETDEIELDEEDDDRPDMMFRVEPIEDGERLDQTFSRLNFSSFGSAIGPGVHTSVSSGSYYEFNANGTFETDGWYGFTASFDGGDSGGAAGTGQRGKQTGRYEIKGNTVTLTVAGDKPEIKSLVRVGEKMLFLDGSMYLDRSD
ncbi:MAG: hypothetical protein AAGK78_06050 [Planctomycetota bacterium]